MAMTDLLLDEYQDLHGEGTAMFSGDQVYRYALTRRWASGGPLTMFVMLNPSTADAYADDPTIRRCIGFARRWGTNGLLVVNAFGLRSTDPRALARHPDPVGPDNDGVITYYLTDHQIGQVVVAWGAGAPRDHDRGRQVTDLLCRLGHEPVCLGVTSGGQPRHPLYLPADTAMSRYPGAS